MILAEKQLDNTEQSSKPQHAQNASSPAESREACSKKGANYCMMSCTNISRILTVLAKVTVSAVPRLAIVATQSTITSDLA